MLTHNLHNFSELEDRIALLHMQQKEVNTSVVSLESQIRHLREMLKYAKQYQKNKIYDDHYKDLLITNSLLCKTIIIGSDFTCCLNSR